MNIYKQKKRWKLLLFFVAILIGATSLLYTNYLMEKLSIEERKRVKLWAKATQGLAESKPDQDVSFLFEVLRNNETIPVLLLNEADSILAYRNIDSAKMENPTYRTQLIEQIKEEHKPITIELMNGHHNFIYYRDSTLLTQLYYYPFIQLGIIFLFILVAYFAFGASRNAEQNHVWLGMSKETAHQLGTPISSLMAWLEMMRETEDNPELIQEVEKDVKRLETIAARFSKIGSEPVLKQEEIADKLGNTLNYVRSRVSQKTRVLFDDNGIKGLKIPLSADLFEWVIENLCKNAIDAMNGNGIIEVRMQESDKFVIIDFKDNGKGIPKSKYKTIFQPGYTTKQRGWGLGLSLAKRIIEEYHKGKIYVKASEPDKYTVIRIQLKK